MDLAACPDRTSLAPQARNALKHAAYARAALLPGEDPEERRLLEESYRDAFQPRSQPEEDAVRLLVDLAWRIQRIGRAEAAMATQAIAEAERKLPESLLGLAAEVHNMDVEIRMLGRLLETVNQAMAEDRRSRDTVRGVGVVLDRLLGWSTPVAAMEPAQVVQDGARALDARSRAVEASRDTLRMLLKASGTALEAARAEASLLDPRTAARLQQERVTLTRSLERQLRVLRDLQGGTGFEGRIVMAEGRIGNFHETSLGEPRPRCFGEVAA